MGKREGALHEEMGRVSVSERYGARACLFRGEGGEEKILERKREKYGGREEGTGRREESRHAREQSH